MEVISQIEARAVELRESGACQAWLAGADPMVAEVPITPPARTLTLHMISF